MIKNRPSGRFLFGNHFFIDMHIRLYVETWGGQILGEIAHKLNRHFWRLNSWRAQKDSNPQPSDP